MTPEEALHIANLYEKRPLFDGTIIQISGLDHIGLRSNLPR